MTYYKQPKRIHSLMNQQIALSVLSSFLCVDLTLPHFKAVGETELRKELVKS